MGGGGGVGGAGLGGDGGGGGGGGDGKGDGGGPGTAGEGSIGGGHASTGCLQYRENSYSRMVNGVIAFSQPPFSPADEMKAKALIRSPSPSLLGANPGEVLYAWVA